jgi:hypothetical protein
VNNIISGIGFYLLGVLTGALAPLAHSNASIAIELRSKINEVVYDLDAILEYEPRDLIRINSGFFGELGSDLERIFASARWYWFFKFWLGFPAKKDIRAAIEKLSEMTRRLLPVESLPIDLQRRRTEVLGLGREVREHLKRRWSLF